MLCLHPTPEIVTSYSAAVQAIASVVSALLACVLVWTTLRYTRSTEKILQEYRKAREAAENSAKAAEKSVEAIMNSDRALVLILWENFIHINPDAPNGVLSHCFNWHIKNSGKSHAFIQTVSSRFIVIKNLKDLPPEPVYFDPVRVFQQWEPVLPDKTVGPIYSPLETNVPYDEMETEHRAKKCILYAYGLVEYLDSHLRPHETRFGIVYNSAPTLSMNDDRFQLAGPSAYNRYT